ncbi:hypothetical protein ASPFODRAFT_64242 [Aspergillus luchuensis CBS 106.47]|uniref:Uncharacterized protein n=1 Tax=Aspergillus luchuensis (strain CBS 106.47) TaxID=1137211 RepID=A0A1M3T606_ASPLC|nr:hypothetical protein ASPFODRAFT_64242 [Aspergillus luchuensis CBS 106.47]
MTEFSKEFDDAQVAGAERLSKSSRAAITKASFSSHDQLRGNENRSLRTQSGALTVQSWFGMKSASPFIVARRRIPTYEPRNVGVVLVMKACTHYRPGYHPTKVVRRQNNPAYYVVYQSALVMIGLYCRGVKPSAREINCLSKLSKFCQSQ